RRERRRGEAAALAVDALVVRERAAVPGHGMDTRALHASHVEHDLAVAELHRGVEHERVAGLERDAPFAELADADLRSLQVRHDADGTPDLAAGVAHELGALHVVLRGAVREVEAHDVHARGEHLLEHRRLARRRAEGRDDLGAALAHRTVAPLAARLSSASTAGRVLPSRNSRNAPPPVEM